MKKISACKQYAAALAFTALLGTGAGAQAAVSVYAEGAYTATDLVVNIYADIPAADTLLSNGVKLKFDKGKIQVPTAADAQKNEAVWFFGDGSVKYPYMNPEVYNDSGEVVVIGGKLDTTPNAPQGVSGNRVLLGKIKFSRKDGGASLPSGTTPEAYFGIIMEKGKGGTYVNFATTAGTSLDDGGISYSATVRERGDANLDGKMTSVDMIKIKQIIGAGPTDSVIADCNADGKITSVDMICVKNKIK